MTAMDNTASVRFWGVRGSIATPGRQTAGVGGNTSCVEVVLSGERILLDGGTGLRALSQARGAAPLEATLLLGHDAHLKRRSVTNCGAIKYRRRICHTERARV